MIEEYKQVKGRPDLLRDTENRAVINKNRNAYNQYVERRRKSQELEQRVENLENKLDTIIDLLRGKE